MKKVDIQAILSTIYNAYCGTEPCVRPADELKMIKQDMKRMMDATLGILMDQGLIREVKVVCDDSVNPPSTVDAGFINCVVYWRPVGESIIKICAAGETNWVRRATRPWLREPVAA